MPLLDFDFDSAGPAVPPEARAAYSAEPVHAKLARLLSCPDPALRAAAAQARATLARPAYISLFGVRSTLQSCIALRCLPAERFPFLTAASSLPHPDRPMTHVVGKWYRNRADRWWLEVTVRDLQQLAAPRELP